MGHYAISSIKVQMIKSDFKKSFPEKCGEAIDMGMGALLEITNDFYAESEDPNGDSTLSEVLESLVSMYNPLNLDDGYYINPDALDWDLHDIGKFCRIVLAKSESSESVDFKNVVSKQLQKGKPSSCDSANLKNADYLNDNSREKQPSGEAPLAETRTTKSLNETDRQMLQTWELFKPAEAIDLKFLVYDSEGRFGGEFTANDNHGDRYFIVKQDPTKKNWKMSSNLISLLNDNTSTLPKSARASLDEYREVLAKSVYRYEAGL